MRVVEPIKNKTNKSSKADKKAAPVSRTMIATIILVGLIFGGWLMIRSEDTDHGFVAIANEDQEATKQSNNDVAQGDGVAAGDEKYQSLWYSLSIPNSKVPVVAPELQNDTEFSRIVSTLAEARGYQLQKVYTGDNLSYYRGVEVEESIIEPLQSLVDKASKEGLVLSISSAYRPLREQEEIFMSRYAQQIASGLSQEDAIIAVLEGAAPPGYSKHHSGYTVDMTCSGLGAKNFIGTDCDIWLAKNDYRNAKDYGFIPSYPNGVDVQGPVPEPWEYNYVGRDTLADLGLL